MKLQTLVLGVLISIGLAVGSAIGTFRGAEISQNVLAAYQTSSIDEYLGVEVGVAPESCKELGTRIKSQLSSSEVPKRVATLVEKFSDTFDGTKATAKTFAWFKGNQEIRSLELSTLDGVGVPRLKGVFGFDATQTVNNVTANASSSELDKEIEKVADRGQLPAGVSTSQWYGDFERKFREACKEDIESAGAAIEKQYNSDITQFNALISNVISTNWTSDGYEKLSPLVAYNPNNGAGCSGWTDSCARFFIETATPCVVDLRVEFTTSGGAFVEFGSNTVRTRAANSRISVQVDGGSGGSGYYEIVEATCR